jgi:HEAT repeat protein
MPERIFRLVYTSTVLILLISSVGAAQSTVGPDEVDARTDPATLVRRLGDREPGVRQRAAENLATLAAVDQKLMIEGYRLQEKDKKVRLALDWALYRTGKAEALYQIIMELDSGRHDQAVGYLAKVDTPAILHGTLKRYEKQPRITVGLIEALALLGNEESLELIKPFRDSLDAGVAAAAEAACDQIEQRLAQAESVTPARPRTVSTQEKP